MPERCRHERNSWLLGGVWEWCFRCGALRKLEIVPGTQNHLRAVSGWLRPVGPVKDNPGGWPDKIRRKAEGKT